MFSWRRVLVAKLRKILLAVAKRMRKKQIPVITIPKKKKTAKTIVPLAKLAVRASCFLWF